MSDSGQLGVNLKYHDQAQVAWIICKNILLAALALFIFLTAIFAFLQVQGVDLPTSLSWPRLTVSLFAFWRNFLTRIWVVKC